MAAHCAQVPRKPQKARPNAKKRGSSKFLPPNVWDPEAAARIKAARTARIEGARKEKSAKAEALKEEVRRKLNFLPIRRSATRQGNVLFRSGNWIEAAEKYRAAAMVAGPQPVFMSNLAASLLKLEL